MTLKLYTQPRCGYCVTLMEVLDKTGLDYDTINIQEDATAKKFMIAEGHKTVPQLYFNNHKINNIDTEKITPEYIKSSVELLSEIEDKWPWQDSGIEQGI